MPGVQQVGPNMDSMHEEYAELHLHLLRVAFILLF